MKLTKEGALSGVSKMFGAQDVEVGDRVFDDLVMVKTDDVRAFKKFLTHDRRQAIVHALSLWPRLQIEGDALKMSVPGKERDPSKLVHAVRSLLHLAGVVSGTSGPSPSPPSSPPPIRRAPPAPILASSPRPAQPASAPVVEARPQPPPAPAPEPEFVEAPVPAPMPPPMPKGPELAAVCAELYRKGLSGLDAEELFTKKFMGKQVSGQGVLRSAQRFSFDIVFGDKPAMRASVDVCEEASSGYGSRTVQSVVKFPEDMRDTLTERSGQEVVFVGKLVKFDRLLRKLYVADGELVDHG